MNKGESGYTLIGVLAIFTIASVLAMSLVALTMTSLGQSNTEADDQAAFYIAEAGLNHKLAQVENIANEINSYTKDGFYEQLNNKLNWDQVIYDDFKMVKGVAPTAEIDIKAVPGRAGEYKVSSKGIIGKQSRTVEQEVAIEWGGSGRGE